MGDDSLETLRKLENTPLDDSNKPQEQITVQSAVVKELPYVTFAPCPLFPTKKL